MDKLGSVTRSMKKRVQWLVKPGSVEDRNVRNVLIDGLGVGIVSGASTFLAVFLARLGASPFLVGMLTSMPALTGMFLAMPVGSMLERQKNVVPWYSRARVWTFFSLALTGIVTMVLPIAWAPWAIILIWAVATFPQTVVNVAFTMVMSAVAGPNRRFYLMSRRWSTIGITSAISVACVGWLLEHFAFPANYQYVFIGSFIGGMISFAFSSQITIPDNEPIEPPTGSKLNWFANMRESLHTVREQVPYTKMLISQFVFRCGLTMVMPLLPLYWVNQLQLSDRLDQHDPKHGIAGSLLRVVRGVTAQGLAFCAVGLCLWFGKLPNSHRYHHQPSALVGVCWFLRYFYRWYGFGVVRLAIAHLPTQT
jgi:hypothetical protein